MRASDSEGSFQRNGRAKIFGPHVGGYLGDMEGDMGGGIWGEYGAGYGWRYGGIWGNVGDNMYMFTYFLQMGSGIELQI